MVTPGFASWTAWPAAMKSSQVWMVRGVHAGRLVEVAAVEHGHRSRVPGHRVGHAAGLQLGALEVGELRLELLGVAQLAQVGEAVGELGPEHLRLVVLDGHDVGEVGPAGRATRQHPVEDLRVAEVLDRHGDAGVRGREAFGHRLQRGGGDVPAPDRDLARQILRLGGAGQRAERQRRQGDTHV
jgi:hypothetical protein